MFTQEQATDLLAHVKRLAYFLDEIRAGKVSWRIVTLSWRNGYSNTRNAI
jgi:hypothetical protein